MPILPEVSARHRAVAAQLVTQWRRMNARIAPDPDIPQDDDDVVDDAEKIAAGILGRLVARLGKARLAEFESDMDVDRMVSDALNAEIGEESSSGAHVAQNAVYAILRTIPQGNRKSQEG